MSSMAAEGSETPAHKQRRTNVARLERQVREGDILQFSENELNEIRIRTYPLTMELIADPYEEDLGWMASGDLK